MWPDIVKEWDKLPVAAYQFIFSQTKERYDEVISESESITEKAFKLISISGAFAAGVVSLAFKTNPQFNYTVILVVFYLANFTCLIKLLFPKQVIPKGSPPNEILIDYLDDASYTEEDKTRASFYQELIRYQERIDDMEIRITKRHKYYMASLILTIINTAATVGMVISTIYHHL